ncbi:MAG: Holliday junction branch migration protein RuvA [Clostridia bacterium]|nr:Holliday junction branch migration protein RuvA [Clostridia bacterium]
MYSYISGQLVNIENNYVTIDVGGVGYEICVSINTLNKLPTVGNKIKLHAYLNVREDEMSLFGFYSREEKALFLKLITVTGVGPKAAIGILSGMLPENLAVCIATGDVKAIAKIKGVGKKIAERLVLELKEKLAMPETDYISGEVSVNVVGMDAMSTEAITALRSLGVTQSEAAMLVSQARKESDTLEELILNALRRMDK